MRLLTVILAVVALAVAGTTMAADVSSSTLGQMGIQGMQTVSDAQGMAIRGKASQTNFENMHRVVQLFKLQDNLTKATPTTFSALAGAVQSNQAKVVGGEYTGGGGDYQATWVQLRYAQTNEINDKGVGQPAVQAIGQGNEIKVKTNDYAVSSTATPGPAISVGQTNTVKSGFSGIVVGGGLTQWNSFDARGFGPGNAAFANQANTSTFTRANISGVQQNRTIVR